MLSEEAVTTNFIVLGVIPPGLEPTINRTREKLANHYITYPAIYMTRDAM